MRMVNMFFLQNEAAMCGFHSLGLGFGRKLSDLTHTEGNTMTATTKFSGSPVLHEGFQFCPDPWWIQQGNESPKEPWHRDVDSWVGELQAVTGRPVREFGG